MGTLDRIFPVIETAIYRLHSESSKFVTRQQIVKQLQEDDESCSVVNTAYNMRDRKMSFEQYTGNMVDWFSEKWTVGDDKWLELFRKFERSNDKIDGCWAYRPSTASAVVVSPLANRP